MWFRIGRNAREDANEDRRCSDAQTKEAPVVEDKRAKPRFDLEAARMVEELLTGTGRFERHTFSKETRELFGIPDSDSVETEAKTSSSSEK